MSLVYADDLDVGRVYQLDSYTLTEDEIVQFAKTWDPQIFHVDKAAAEAGAYGGLIASGLHTLSIYQRLAVTGSFGEWSVIAGKRLSDVQFLRPVRPGDTLTGTLVIDAVDIDPRSRVGDHHRRTRQRPRRRRPERHGRRLRPHPSHRLSGSRPPFCWLSRHVPA